MILIFASLVNFIVCAVCCNLDLCTDHTYDRRPSIKPWWLWELQYKKVKSSINHFLPCPKRAVWLHHCFQELKRLISVSFFISESVWNLAVCILINNTCMNVKKSFIWDEEKQFNKSLRNPLTLIIYIQAIIRSKKFKYRRFPVVMVTIYSDSMAGLKSWESPVQTGLRPKNRANFNRIHR